LEAAEDSALMLPVAQRAQRAVRARGCADVPNCGAQALAHVSVACAAAAAERGCEVLDPPAEAASKADAESEEGPIMDAAPLAAGAARLPKLNMLQLSSEEMRTWIAEELGEAPYRAEQILESMYEQGVEDFRDMKSLPSALRRKLRRRAAVGAEEWQVLARRESTDGTVKVAYGVPGGHAIESVLMPYADGRQTACISSQVGCAMNCAFCATGQMGFKRHLAASEIFEQAARWALPLRRKGSRLSSVVLLGMGEPLANYGNVLSAVRRIHAVLGIGFRHITISTVGLVPKIYQLAEEKLPITLAISLHAATDEERSALLPVNKRYPIAQVMKAAKHYRKVTGRRVSFEWTLIDGRNDDPETARRLGQLIARGAPGAHVNLIPLNPTGGYGGQPPSREAVAAFVEGLARFGIEATVRVRRGIDIDAGCGQLAERALLEPEPALAS